VDGDIGLGHLVHLPCGLENQKAEHFCLACQFNKGKLDCLIDGERLAKGLAGAGVFNAFVDAIKGGAGGAGGLADAVFMDKMLGEGEAAVKRAEKGTIGHPDVFQGEAGMICGHVEGPHIFFDDDAGIISRDKETGDAFGVAIFAGGAGKAHHMCGGVLGARRGSPYGLRPSRGRLLSGRT